MNDRQPRIPPTESRSPRARCLLLALALLAGACGDDAATANFDTGGRPDIGSDTFISSDTTTATQTDIAADGIQSDTGPEDTTQDTRIADTGGPLVTFKDDPTYLVPGNIAQKANVTAFGSRVAWVETPADGGPFFVVWDLARGDDGLHSFFVANLAHPRQLALSDSRLVYVDDRYGDPDVFAVDLASGETQTVAARQGAQVEPTVLGARVAWADCRACVSGDDGAGWEIYSRDGEGPETRVTNDAEADRGPSLGTLGGEDVLAWVRGRAEARVVGLATLTGGAGRDDTIDLASELRASDHIGWLAVTPGVLAFRSLPLIVNPDSMIVNPDSMYPSDVYVNDVLGDGTTTQVTRHGELRGGQDGALRAAGKRLGWLQSAPAAIGTTSDSLVVSDDGTVSSVVTLPSIESFGLGTGALVFSAPRADNGGLPDAWVLPLD